jgi:DNA-binding transcriptional MocR family regulator
MVQVFIYCLLRANHQKRQWRGIDIAPGQFVTSYSHMADDLNCGVQRIRTAIKRLKSTRELTSKSTNKYSIITICNYSTYQILDDENNQPANKPANKQLTSNQQATNNKQECKKEKKEQLPYGEPFSATWKDWQQFRKEKKQKLTPTSISRQLKKLSAYNSESIAIAVLEQSMTNGWAGLFDLKDKRALTVDPLDGVEG